MPKADRVMNEAQLDKNGHELVSDVPVAPPVGYKKQPTMVDHIRAMVRSEKLRQEAEEAGAESFDEADDFNIPDDPIDPTAPFEEQFEPEVPAAPPPKEPVEPLPASPAPAPVAPASETAPKPS